MSSKIITLPTQLANQIAAGEVVERPVSVVKELVENSLDAGATQIEVRLRNGGIDLIEVRDNGEGIAPEDLQKALEKYSTSKIKTLEDLYEVMTFGFRGEALASIASVSQFSMSSKQAGATAGRIIISQGGQEVQEQDVAHEVGTTVRVEQLFYNTPARLNYLKQARSEYLKVLQCLQAFALCFPKVSFRLEHEEKQSLYFSQEEGFLSRVSSLFGEDFRSHLLSIDHRFGGIRVSGIISDPKISFPQKTKQLLYVNTRAISSPMISKAIFEAYHRYIPHGSYPGYILFLEVDPTQVDVNVHPRKLEVRFAQESSLFRSAYHAIEDALKSVSLSKEAQYSQNIDTLSSLPFSPSASVGEAINTPKYYTGSGNKFKHYSPYTNTQAHPAQAGLDFFQASLGKTPQYDSEGSTSLHTGDLHDTPLGRIIGQVHRSYIMLETPSGVMMLDQHALAERVIFEKLAHSSYTPKVQQLLSGIGMHLDIHEYEAYHSYQAILEEMGFITQELSHQNILLTALPDFLGKQDIEKVFRALLGDIGELGSKNLENVRHKIWAYTSCRAAVKFGDPLSLFEMHALLRDAQLDYSATCPHGRPVVYEVSLLDLQKKYER